jgi:hypothetical protein
MTPVLLVKDDLVPSLDIQSKYAKPFLSDLGHRIKAWVLGSLLNVLEQSGKQCKVYDKVHIGKVVS